MNSVVGGGRRTSAVQIHSWDWSCWPWALWPLSHWIVCTATAEPSEPSALTQIHRQEFPLARKKIDKGFYLTPGAKVWLAAFLPWDGRMVQRSWPLNNWWESMAECEMLLRGRLHGAHATCVPVAQRYADRCCCSPADLYLCIIWCRTKKIKTSVNLWHIWTLFPCLSLANRRSDENE